MRAVLKVLALMASGRPHSDSTSSMYSDTSARQMSNSGLTAHWAVRGGAPGWRLGRPGGHLGIHIYANVAAADIPNSTLTYIGSRQATGCCGAGRQRCNSSMYWRRPAAAAAAAAVTCLLCLARGVGVLQDLLCARRHGSGAALHQLPRACKGAQLPGLHIRWHHVLPRPNGQRRMCLMCVRLSHMLQPHDADASRCRTVWPPVCTLSSASSSASA